MFDENGKLVFNLSDTLFCPWDHPHQDLDIEMQQIPNGNQHVEPRYPTKKPPDRGDKRSLAERRGKRAQADRKDQPPLADLAGNLFIWGHGDQGHVISDGGDQRLTVRELALLLERCGLRRDFQGHIVLWTCWAGAAGGFARSLGRHLDHLGYAVPVWGSKYVTCNMVLREFGVIRRAPSGGGANLDRRQCVCAYRSDMVCFPPSGAGRRQASAPDSVSSSGVNPAPLSDWSAGLSSGSGTSAGWNRGSAPGSGSGSGSGSSQSMIGTRRE
jgi:hypothetical protein